MSTKNTLPRPEGHHSITPSMIIAGAAKIITFIEEAFGGKVVERYDGPNGEVFHAEVKVGDSVIMMGEPQGQWGPMPAALSYYVATGDEVDATYKRALAAGAQSMTAPQNQFYGYRSASVVDAGGNKWTICAVIEQLTKEQIAARMKDLPK